MYVNDYLNKDETHINKVENFFGEIIYPVLLFRVSFAHNHDHEVHHVVVCTHTSYILRLQT